MIYRYLQNRRFSWGCQVVGNTKEKTCDELRQAEQIHPTILQKRNYKKAAYFTETCLSIRKTAHVAIGQIELLEVIVNHFHRVFLRFGRWFPPLKASVVPKMLLKKTITILWKNLPKEEYFSNELHCEHFTKALHHWSILGDLHGTHGCFLRCANSAILCCIGYSFKNILTGQENIILHQYLSPKFSYKKMIFSYVCWLFPKRFAH